ncbi:MAG: UvrB/UvrC motif-containing protein [Oscillospiraceae bacterium]|nr:UvrB/UvrC motif-containing protein [Oscillospiraceae bacterium]
MALCERCKKKPASAYFRQIVDGVEKEMRLCQECAEEMGIKQLGGIMNPFSSFDFGNILGQFFGQTALGGERKTSGKRCSSCGSSFQDMVNTGKAGCAQCYKEFYGELLPSIQRIHGKTEHIGKISRQAGLAAQRENLINSYKEELKKSIEEENYERAAQLRDMIKTAEAGEEDDQA